MKLWSRLALAIIAFVNVSATSIEESIVLAHQNSDEVAIKQLNLKLKKGNVLANIMKFIPNTSYTLERGQATLSTDEPIFGSPPGSTSYAVKNDIFEVSTDRKGLHRVLASSIFAWHDFQSEKAKYESFLNEMTVSIVSKHLDIIIGRESVDLMRMIDSVSKINIKNADLKRLNQSMSVNEHLDFESKHDDASARLIQAKMALDAVIRDYEILTNKKPDNLLMKREFSLPAKSFDDYLMLIENSNKDLESHLAAMKVASSSAAFAYADIFTPRVSAVYRDSKTVFGFIPGSPLLRTQEALVSVNFNIYDGGEVINNAIKADINNRIVKRQENLIRYQLKQRANQHWSDHHSLLLLERSKRKAMDRAEVDMISAENRHKNKSSSDLELLTSKIDFYNAKVAYLRTYKEFVVNYYKLLSLI